MHDYIQAIMSCSKKSSNISSVWNYFEKDTIISGVVTCLLCKKEYKTSGNTSNLRDHIKRKHKDDIEPDDTDTVNLTGEKRSLISDSNSDADDVEVRKVKKQNSLTTYISRKEIPYSESNNKKIMLDYKLAYMIAKDFQPYSVVHDKGFRDFIVTLDPKYKLPSKDTLKNKLVPKLFEEMTNKLNNIFKAVNSMSLTTDLWTSSRTNEAYITVTSHFIYENKLCSAVLETSDMPGSHTAVNIKDRLQLIISKWNIEDKISCIVTDNGQNMVLACSLLKIRHAPCFAHTLNLTVNDGLKKNEELTNLLNKCRTLVKYFKKSTLAMDTLRSEQRKTNNKILKLLQDVSTRWNSVLYMVERIITIGDSLILALLHLPKAPPALSCDDYIILKEIVILLKPFESATKQISGDGYVTISLVIPIVYGLYTELLKVQTTLTTDVAKQLYADLNESIVKRLFPYEARSAFRICTLLDPRFKKYGFRVEENFKQAQAAVQQEIGFLYRSDDSNKNPENEDVEQGGFSQDASEGGLFTFLKQRISQAKSSATATSEAVISMRQYLELPTEDINSNPIEYWRKMKNDSNMRIVALKFLSITATSVPSERIFSKTGLIISDKRSSLKPKNVNMLTFINQNYWLINNE